MYVLEGLKGSGKTTAQKLVWEKLYRLNPDRAERGELHRFGPWETAFGLQIREMLIEQAKGMTSIHAHLILASRMELIEKILFPIWDEDRKTGQNTIVIMDRWTDSTLANQGRGYEAPALSIVGYSWPWSDPMTFFLDVTPKAALIRRQLREKDSFTITLDDEKAYTNYLTLANRNNHVIIDGMQPAEAIADFIVEKILEDTEWQLK